MQITIHTDGAASGNPGPGGFGAILHAGKHQRELSGGFRRTTNNRMELLAVIVALEAIKEEGHEVLVVSDSKYVVDAVEKRWVFGWEKQAFAKKKNPDLWKRFLVTFRKQRVRFQWIRGHNGHPLNERCDRLAVSAREQPGLPPDVEYERMEAQGDGIFA